MLTEIDRTPTVYQLQEVAPFRRSRERFGQLSNMTGGYRLEVNGMTFQSPEGLYQALKFPNDPGFQEKIAKTTSAMTAKKSVTPGEISRPTGTA